jgi:hypothetical protein
MKSSTTRTLIAAASAVSMAALATFAQGATLTSFTPGDLVIYRVGDGSAALTSASTAVFLDEYTPTGTLVGSLPMPTAASGTNNPLSSSGTATSEGLLTLSTNGAQLMVTGYAAAPGVASIAGTSTTTTTPTLRDIGEVDASTNINTSTTTTSFSGNNIRSATSIDGSTIWAAGAATGVVSTSLGGSGAGTVDSTTLTNIRQINIFGGQLLISTGSGSTFRLGAVGTGTSTATGQTVVQLPGVPVGSNATTPLDSPYSYYLTQLNSSSTGPDTLYIADDTLTNSGAAGEILKYSLVAGTWTANGAIAAGAVRGLTGVTVGGVVDLFATTGGGTSAGGGTLYGVVDSSGFDSTLTATATSLATAATDESFRGVAFAPTAVPEPAALSLLALGATSLLGRRRRTA